MADRRTKRSARSTKKRSTTRRTTTRTKRSAHGRSSTRKLSPGARAWNQHVMKTFNEMRKKNRAATFKDALRTAAKTYKK